MADVGGIPDGLMQPENAEAAVSGTLPHGEDAESKADLDSRTEALRNEFVSSMHSAAAAEGAEGADGGGDGGEEALLAAAIAKQAVAAALEAADGDQGGGVVVAPGGSGSGMEGPSQHAPQQLETVQGVQMDDDSDDVFEDVGEDEVEEDGGEAAQGPSTSRSAAAGPQPHAIEVLDELEDEEEEAAIDAAVAALGVGSGAGEWESAAVGMEDASGSGEGGGSTVLSSLLGRLQAAAAAAGSAMAEGTGKIQDVVGKHVTVGKATGVGAQDRARSRDARFAGLGKKQKVQTARDAARASKKQEAKALAREEQAKAKREAEQEEAAIRAMTSSDKVEAFAEVLNRFADACRTGNLGEVHLLHSNLFSKANQVIVSKIGLPPPRDLPWKPKSLPEFFQACYVLAIRATGGIDLANEIERMNWEYTQDDRRRDALDFSQLVADAAKDEESMRVSLGAGARIDREMFQAKRDLIHEWIEKGYLDVLSKAINLLPQCITAPREPPLVTALRAGHNKKVITLLLKPCDNHRPRGVDEASPTDGATAVALAIENNRTDVLGQILKLSSRWSMAVKGKPWTPLCYALAQGHAGMVPLLLAHAKKGKPEAAELAEYVDEVCEGATALHRAVAVGAHDMARLLVEAGADPTIRTRESGRATSALHLAAAQDQLQPLLEQMLAAILEERRPAVLNTLVDQADNTLLHWAVARGAVPLAELLLGMGARPTSRSESRSPLLRLLLKLQQVGIGDGAGGDAPREEEAAAAAEQEDQEQDALRQMEGAFLAHWRAEDTTKALHPSQRPADSALLHDWLLQRRGVTLDPILSDAKQRQAVGQAAVDDRNRLLLELLLDEPGFSAQGLYLHRLVDRLKGTQLDLMQRLLDAGASMHERQPPQGTPLLHKAAEENDLACLEALLAWGADVAAVDDQGNNVLHAVARQKAKAGVVYAGVVARLVDLAPQLLTQRNEAFFLPSDSAPADSAVEAQLEALTKRQLDAGKVAEEAERWARAAKDWTQLGPPTEDAELKRQRIDAMLSSKLAPTVQNIQRQEKLGAAAGLQRPDSAGATTIPPERRAIAASAEPTPPTTPTSIYRQRPHKRSWADLADEMPAVVRLPVWPESLEAAAAAARADPAAAVAQILRRATPEGAAPISSLSELPWEMDIHRDAWAEWMGMEARHRRLVLQLLLRIGEGRFDPDPSKTIRKMSGSAAGDFGNIEVYLAQLPRSASLIFEVAPEVDVRRSMVDAHGQRHMQYHDVIRIWFVSLDEGRASEALDLIAASYRKGQSARRQLLLEAHRGGGGSGNGGGNGVQEVRLPADYRSREVDRAAAATAAAAIAAEAAAGGGKGVLRRRYFPPASTEADSYTVLKFHPLEDAMLHSVMTNEGQTDVDFRFRLSPAEADVVERMPYPPQSLILLGRSGTGKTTVALFRMFDRWRRSFEDGQPLHQVFVTVSATLKEQVAKAFVRLRSGLPAVTPDRAAAYAAAAARPYHSFKGLPEEAWPLFLSAKQYLHMLDGTLRQPFFKRRADGSFFYASEAQDDDDGMSVLVDLAHAGAAAGEGGSGAEPAGGVEEGARIRVTFSLFQSSMFRRLRPGQKVDFDASLAWQEIVSYIKGTKQAVEGSGRLTEDEYLSDIGRKQAPNFGPESRRLIYQLSTAYEQEKKRGLTEGHVTHFLYDAADVVAWIHRRLREEGYRGEPIHELYCDEVQDFTQAELLLSLRVVSDPNGIALFGDTCQTIARGIGFRFTDVKQLFYQAQREAQLAASAGKGWDEAAVQMPDIVPLEVNYRTHSGVLDVAASVVQLLRRFFSEQIDDLKPEQAFLEAPHLPLLLPAATPGNVAMLLSGGDANEAWKTEFGANQVVLRRTLASPVPHFLAKIDAVVMTIPQAKGLEFNDVFILNFFADSPCKEEWRILLQYLAELEEKEKKGGPEAMPFGKPLAPVSASELGFSGARLDVLNFDETQHKLLCEELKHLYTAVTRAKNAVVFFDSSPQAHAPFYYYLARLGLARVVTGQLKLEEGKDLHQLGLSKSKSTPADWIRRAQTMVRTANFDAAATCFRKAGNSSRAQACQAQAKLQAAAELDEDQEEAKAQALRFEAGYTLLGTAVNAPPHEADAAERRDWLLLAAAALKAAGQEAAAQQISAALGNVAGRAAQAAVAGPGGLRGGPVRSMT